MLENPLPARVLLADDPGGPGRIVVDYEPFAQYEAAMDAALEKLVDRWLPLAAPRAGRSKRSAERAQTLGPQE